jgi:hypothetical protein
MERLGEREENGSKAVEVGLGVEGGRGTWASGV